MVLRARAKKKTKPTYMGVVGSAAKTPPREVTNATRATTFTRHVFVEAFIWFGYRLDTKKKECEGDQTKGQKSEWK